MARHRRARNVVLPLAWLLTAALAVLVVLRLTGSERGTVLALLVGALPLTLLPAYLVLAVAAVLRRRLLAALCSAVILAHLGLIAPAIGAAPLPDQADAAPQLRVVTSNLFLDNPEPQAAGRALRALRPDVLVVPELTARSLAGLRASGLLTDLPHSVVELGSRSETVGLFSRQPLTDVTTRSSGGRQLPRATIEVGGVPVRLLTAHPLPPLSLYEGLWRESLRDLTAEAQTLDGPAVMAGDFNADRDHAPFRALLGAGMRDAADERGRGLMRTWPAYFPVLQLDHVLLHDQTEDGVTADRIVATAVRQAHVPGSDHLAVIAELAVVPAAS